MVTTKRISLETKGNGDIIDITPLIEQQIAEAGLHSGTATIFVPGSTAGVSTMEFEPGLLSDFKNMWERNIPKTMPYAHDLRWGDGNGYAHVRASLLGPSLVVPFADKRLTLGTWQQIIFVDFDNRPRSRQIVIQIMGE